MANMATAMSFDDLWAKAWKDYLKATGRTPEESATLKTLKTPEDLYQQIEKSQRKFGDFRVKHSRVFKALSTTVRPFAFLSTVASTALSVTPCAPASAILGAVGFLISAADGVSEAYDWIEELFTKLAGFAERL